MQYPVSATKQCASSKEALHKQHQKLAAWTSLPLKEEMPVQSENKALLCPHLHCHSSAVCLSGQKNVARFAPPPCPLTLMHMLTADFASSFKHLSFALSKSYLKVTRLPGQMLSGV